MVSKEELLRWLNTHDSWDESERLAININDNLYEFDWYQTKQIYLGLQAGVDVSFYSNPEFSFAQMREIKEGLMDGVDARLYADPKLSVDEMYHMRNRLEDQLPSRY